MHGGHGKQDTERAAARGEQVPSKPTRCRRAKKAREDVDTEGATAWVCTPTILMMVILAMVTLVVLALGWALILVVLGVASMLNHCRTFTPEQFQRRHTDSTLRFANLHDITGYNVDVGRVDRPTRVAQTLEPVMTPGLFGVVRGVAQLQVHPCIQNLHTYIHTNNQTCIHRINPEAIHPCIHKYSSLDVSMT